MQLSFTIGDVPEAISIMREAAQWLMDAGKPMWRLETVTRKKITNPAEEFHVLYVDGESAATMLLSFHDPFFWPEVPAGASGFVHKLAVRRRFAGQGLGEAMLSRAAALCREKGVPMLRLDTDPHRPGLCALYERAGFRRVDARQVLVPSIQAVMEVARYEREV